MFHLRGHPIHTAIIHFPIACYVLSFVVDVCSREFPLVAPAIFSYYLLIAGTATGAFALCTGFIDLIGISDSRAMRIALWHGGLNFLWFCIFGGFVLVDFREYPNLTDVSVFQ